MEAVISECGRFRYDLSRVVDATSPRSVVFIMLNPSTADASKDDPTIRRCVGFARAWGFGSLWVVNLYAFRSTSPTNLAQEGYLIGPENDDFIVHRLDEAHEVVCAWGDKAQPERVEEVKRIMRLKGETPWSIGALTKAGNPRHPLYLAANTPLVPYDLA